MAGRDELLLAAAVVVVGLVLIVLLLVPGRTFVSYFEKGLDVFKDTVTGAFEATVSSTVSTRSTTTTTTTTSTSEATTSTTRTTSSTTTFSVTTTSSATTTTASGRRCESEEDCGGIVSEIRCKGNSVWNYTTKYECHNRGTEYSQCVGRMKSRVVRQCEDYEDCKDGLCDMLYDNLCDMRCDEDGYADYYCTHGSCGLNATSKSVKGGCTDWGPTCCCTNG